MESTSNTTQVEEENTIITSSKENRGKGEIEGEEVKSENSKKAKIYEEKSKSKEKGEEEKLIEEINPKK